MECFKKSLLYLFIVLFVNVSSGQENKSNSFLEISEIGRVKFSHQGAFWYANEEVTMAIGGVDNLVGMDTLKGGGSNWQPKIFVFNNTQNNGYAIPQFFDLPYGPIAFGASAISPDGIFCIGGVSPNGNSKKVFKVKWDADSKDIKIDSLVPLPVPLAFAGSVYFQDKLYVVGAGLWPSQEENNSLFILDLNNLEKGWEILESPVGKWKASPSLVVQGDGVENCLYIFWGGQQERQLSKGFLKYNLKSGEWSDVREALEKDTTHVEMIGHHAKAIGNASIIFFEQHKLDSSELQTGKIGVFNTITNAYTKVGKQLPFLINDLIGKTDSSILAIAENEDNNFLIIKLKIIEEAAGFGFVNIAVLASYFVLMLLIGVYFSKNQKTADDYFKAGKKIPFWAAGLSILGTGLSAITFMAVPAKTFATDWAYFVNRLPTFLVAIIIGLFYVPVFRRLDVSTAYEYLQKRFNLATRLIGSFSFIIFQLGRIGIVLFLPAVALNVVTGFDVVACIVIVGMVSLLYTVMGGMEAVIWTDVIQVFILYGGIVLCLGFISFGLDGGVNDVISIGKENEKFNIFDFSFNLNEPNFWVVVFGSFFTNLTTYGSDQTMVQRYLTTKTTKDATKSIWITIIFGLLLGWMFFFMGTALFAFYKTHPGEMMHTMASNDAIFPWYIISQLPKGISGLLIAGIFAAAMSSLSSSMNSAATAYTMDFHQLYKKEFNAVNVGRVVTLIIGVGGILFAILFATMNVKSIWDEFLKIIGLMTGGLGGVFLLGIITKKANGAGVLIGLLFSAIVQYFVGIYHPFNLLLFTASGFIACFVFGYLFSWLLPMYDKPVEGLTIYSTK